MPIESQIMEYLKLNVHNEKMKFNELHKLSVVGI